MSERDALGRRRTADQSRGLRPMFPALPSGVRSRSVRVAMGDDAWRRLAERVEGSTGETAPRLIGRLLASTLSDRRASVTDWQEWQIRKEQQLLERGGEAAAS